MKNAHGKVVEAGDDDFESVVLGADRTVLVEFGATWCGPCKALAPIVEDLAEEHAETLKVVKVDIDDAPEVAKRYGIRGVPTVIVFGRGEVVARQTGLTSKAVLRGLVPLP